MITYKCLKCGAECCVDDNLAGQEHECGSCGNVHIVPSPESQQGHDCSEQSPPLPGEKERTLAIIANLGIFTSLFIMFGNCIVPLVIMLAKKHSMPDVADACKKALNFQISMTIYTFVAYLMLFIVIGFFLVPIVIAFNIICSIIAAVKASDGQQFKYPLSIKFIK